MRSSLGRPWAVWAIVALLAPAAPADDKAAASPAKYTLRYKFRPGETLRWQVVDRKQVETMVSGTSQTAEMVSSSVKVWRIKEVKADGSVVFEHLVESVDMRHKFSGRAEVRYNSQTDKQPPVGYEKVAKSVGTPLAEFTLDPRGKILDRVQRPVPGVAPSEGQITLPLPEKAVAIGQTWSFPYDLDLALPQGGNRKIKTQQNFTLESVKGPVASVRVSTQILTPVHDPAIEAQLIQRESAGVVRFDLEAGRVVGQQIDVDKRVIGFRGEASSIHYVTRFTEELLADAAKTAQAPLGKREEKR